MESTENSTCQTSIPPLRLRPWVTCLDVVTKQVIEQQLLAPLAETLSPRSVAGYTEEKVQNIASEPFEFRKFRAHLESKRWVLEEGAEAFQAGVIKG
jgi:hypothetical protein